ncbi:hypothetical protein MJO28_009822 [Puccinia striiformis f. sp. tritici]|uniref:White collar 2 protein n=2 Tax=Puccinia striiformis TaxID=27350 RepID=A0A2S4VEJ5_9BASI|nr:hypothetical protein Pst134EA_017339 [Puccinia striiformis f. sp. tritici]KAI9607460.1 hypothetical protein H4Q26_005982 [Puccinia striiformis f. sp. tritici PST-130]POW07962.1 hypothetical protein PSTT_07891 [Puccinia striiformis]KAH9461030.1 hypothetical protein Pst134EA_017339 [Puccinia striiformis f. sp. tritici]KAI7947914.1 hypothetical protein MJO28_009822 [Puccinia striiformis f. sp. tritici]KAI7950914.1 hypothetical protein MJO29_009588 [Puccinia striiformis f. sp. tritici]
MEEIDRSEYLVVNDGQQEQQQQQSYSYNPFFDFPTQLLPQQSNNSSSSNPFYYQDAAFLDIHPNRLLSLDHQTTIDPLQTITDQLNPTSGYNQFSLPYTQPTAINPSNITTTTTITNQHHHHQPQPVQQQQQQQEETSSTRKPSKTMNNILSQDFKRRKDWDSRLITDVMDVLQVISPSGELLFVNESIKRLTGYNTIELIGHQLSSTCFDRDDQINLDREIKKSFALGSDGLLNLYCRFKKRDTDTYVIFEMMGHIIRVKTNPGYLRGETKSEKRVMIINARPYPTSSGRLTNEFLELMLENQAMIKLIRNNNNNNNNTTTTSCSEITSSCSSSNLVIEPEIESTTTTSLSRIEGDLHRPSIPDLKTQSTEEHSVPEGEDPQTVGKESDNEDESNHHSITTTTTTNTNTNTDHAAASSPAKLRISRPSNKRDRVDFLCLDCGVTQSPEWRKGPQGRKTLCNACGLRYAKKSK